MTQARISVAAFDSVSTMAAGTLLEGVCRSSAWVVALVATRPHHTVELLRTRSDEALAALEWPDIEQALAFEPSVDASDDRRVVRHQLASVVRGRLGDAFEDVDPRPVPPMWISLDGAENVRDVGGLAAERGTVRPGALLRADSLHELTDRDVRRLVDDFGVTAVADLRTGVELAGEGPGPFAREHDVELVHLSLFPEDDRPDHGAHDVLPWQRRAGDDDGSRLEAWQVYLAYLDQRADSVLDALRLIARTPGATLVHCAAGKDRTGTVVALALTEVGVTREAVVEDYVRSAERVERIFERLARRALYSTDIGDKLTRVDKHKPRAETMQRLLDGIDTKFGGVSAWLRSHGWTDEDAQSLHAKLLG